MCETKRNSYRKYEREIRARYEQVRAKRGYICQHGYDKSAQKPPTEARVLEIRALNSSSMVRGVAVHERKGKYTNFPYRHRGDSRAENIRLVGTNSDLAGENGLLLVENGRDVGHGGAARVGTASAGKAAALGKTSLLVDASSARDRGGSENTSGKETSALDDLLPVDLSITSLHAEPCEGRGGEGLGGCREHQSDCSGAHCVILSCLAGKRNSCHKNPFSICQSAHDSSLGDDANTV